MKSKEKQTKNLDLKKEIHNILTLYNSKEFLKAKNKTKKLIEIYPKESNYYNLLGLILSQENKTEEAANVFKKAIKINPNFAVAYNNLGNIYKNRGNIKIAIDHYKHAIKLDPVGPEPYNNLGNLYKSINKVDESIRNYKKAIEINPKLFTALNNLGNAYKSIGKFDEATTSYLRSIKVNSENYYTYRNLGLIIKWDEQNPLFLKMKKAYSENNFSKDQKRELTFALGKAYEDIKDFQKSFHCYERANFIAKDFFSYSNKKNRDEFNSIKKTFNKKVFKDFKIIVKKKIQNKIPIFIVGMPRSGTSLVEQILSSHSKIYGAGETEIIDNLIKKHFYKKKNFSIYNNFFNNDKKTINKLVSEYFDIIKKFSNSKNYVTDKLPFNFKWIGFIKLIFPNAKIIHCNRSKKDICFSIYKNYFPYRKLDFAYSFKSIIEYYKLYENLMIHWNQISPKIIYDLQYEKLVEQPNIQIKKLLNYLELNWEDSCMNFYKNNRAVNTASDIQVRKPIYKTSINNWKQFEKFLPDIFNKLKD